MRVPKRYGAAVDVQFLRICIQGLQPSQWNGGEGFVNLIKVDVSDLEASAFQNALGRWDRLFQHHHRVPGGYREMRDSCLWREVVYLQRLFGHDQHRRRTIGDLARIRGGDGAAFRERPYATDRLNRRVPPNAFVCHMRSEEHTSELQSLMRNSYSVFCLKKKI